MHNYVNRTFTASASRPITRKMLEDVLKDYRLSAVSDFAHVTFVEKGTAFPKTPRYVFGLRISNNAFGTALIDAANQAALEILHVARARNIDITPSVVIHQTNGGFYRNDMLETSFDNPVRQFRTFKSAATEGTLRPGVLRP